MNIDSNHRSLETALVIFEDPISATKAIEARGKEECLQAHAYQSKQDLADGRKKAHGNKLYVRYLPADINEEQVRQIFAYFGTLSDLSLKVYNHYTSAIVTYEIENGNDANHGEKSAAWALMEINGKHLPEGNPMALHVSKYGQKEPEHSYLANT